MLPPFYAHEAKRYMLLSQPASAHEQGKAFPCPIHRKQNEEKERAGCRITFWK